MTAESHISYESPTCTTEMLQTGTPFLLQGSASGSNESFDQQLNYGGGTESPWK